MKLLIQHGRVIDPASGRDEVADIAIAAGRIVGIGNVPADFNPSRSIDARGCWVLPGLVDLLTGALLILVLHGLADLLGLFAELLKRFA